MKMEKACIREEARRRLREQGGVTAAKSDAVCARLGAWLRGQTARCVLASYVAIQAEPNVTAVMSGWLQSGKKLLLPRYHQETGDYEMVAVNDLGQSLVTGRYHIQEPRQELIGMHPPFEGDSSWIWLIPGLAFDLTGHRLGRGGGYYDRLLRGTAGLKIGVGYDCQIFDALPSEPHDIGVQGVVTESRFISCSWQ